MNIYSNDYFLKKMMNNFPGIDSIMEKIENFINCDYNIMLNSNV